MPRRSPHARLELLVAPRAKPWAHPWSGAPGSPAPWVGLLLVIAVAPWAAGCIWPTDAPFLADQEPPPIGLVTTAPTSGAEGVPCDGDVIFYFDAPVHPDAVTRQTAYLTTGSDEVSCARRLLLLDCALALRPHAPLAPLLTYRAEVEGVFGFDAGPLAEPRAVVFTTGDASAMVPPPPAPTLEAIVAEVFVPRCAACHSGARPPAGLDLTTPERAAAGLVEQESPLRPGSVRVVPGRHASSYLMWKLLDLPSVFGDAMPPTGDWPTDRGCGTADADLRRIADWIDSL